MAGEKRGTGRPEGGEDMDAAIVLRVELLPSIRRVVGS
jgi:hypothetical protein